MASLRQASKQLGVHYTTLRRWIQLGTGPKRWWGKEPEAGSPYGGGSNLGTRVGPLPAVGKWARLTATTAALGIADGQAIPSLTLQEYGGVVYWDDVALTGTRPATYPRSRWRPSAARPRSSERRNSPATNSPTWP